MWTSLKFCHLVKGKLLEFRDGKFMSYAVVSSQSVQSVQADMDQNFFLFANFLIVKRPVCLNFLIVKRPVCLNFPIVKGPVCLNFLIVKRPVCLNFLIVKRPVCLNFLIVKRPVYLNFLIVKRPVCLNFLKMWSENTFKAEWFSKDSGKQYSFI